MTGFEAARWQMRKLFSGSLSRPNLDGAANPETDLTLVRLIDSPSRLPATPIEQRLISTLKEAGAVSLASLVKTVAADLYADELHKGAGVLDIGLFGCRLFNGEVVQELKAGDGILWEIKQEREIA